MQIATGSFSPSCLVLHPVLRLVRQDVPTAYVRLEHIIREMRTSLHMSGREGEQRPFYTLEQFGEVLHKPMKEAKIRESDLIPGLRFLHNVSSWGHVYQTVSLHIFLSKFKSLLQKLNTHVLLVRS